MLEQARRQRGLHLRSHGKSWWASIGIVVVMAAASSGASAGQITSAGIDYSIYREGEVQRHEQQFEAWQLTCDEIKRLGRKFCSLRGVVRADDGTIVAALTVSTDDEGRPAALLRLPFGTVLTSSVNVLRVESSTKKRKPSLFALRPTLCDGSGCEALWPIAAADIRSLTANEKVRISFRMTRAPMVLGPLLRLAVPVEGTVQTTGFASALQASLVP